jgi:hypothetical protein
MSTLQNIDYKVVLVFPGFGEERENAEQIVEAALQYLNTQKDEPGMRFAQNVSAHLDIVMDAEQAQAKLDTEDDLAMMILHDLPDDEKTALTEDCARKGVLVCHTVDAPENPRRGPRPPRGEPRQLKVVFRKGRADEPRAHRIPETTLTASLEDDEEELLDRVGQIITVLALGVMEHHWTRNPPVFEMGETE